MHLRTRTRTGLFLVALLAAACAGQSALAAHGELSRSINAGTRALTAEISFSTDFEVKTFELDNPPRFVVDMEPALLPNGGVPGGVTYSVDSRGVKSIRLAQNNRTPDRVRIVFDLKTKDTELTLDYDKAAHRLTIREPGAQTSGSMPAVKNPEVSKSAKSTVLTFAVTPKKGDFKIVEKPKGYGQILEVSFPGYAPAATGLDIGAGVVESLSWSDGSSGAVARIATRAPVSHRLEYSSGKLVLRMGQPSVSGVHVCVDAGHGGKDPGTMGFDGTTEKEIVLDIALRLRDMFQAAGARVSLTRSSDYYLTLGERTTAANGSGCQYFISIHGNALPDHDSKSGRRGAQSYYYSQQSKDFAAAMLKEMVLMMRVGDMGLFERSLYVTKNTRMSSVLVEIAFLSDRDDLALLKTPEFRENAARSLYNGLESHLGMSGARMMPLALPASVARLVPATPYSINSASQARIAELPTDLKEVVDEPAVAVAVPPARETPVKPAAKEIPAADETEILVVSRSVPAPLREEWPAPSGGFKPRLRQTGAIYPKEPWNFKRDYMGPMSQAPR